MAANINSNFTSIHLIPSSIQGTAKQQQIQALTNQVKGNEDKIAKIDKEIIAREKIIEASEKIIFNNEKIEVEALKIIDYGQKGIKACEESKEIIKEMIGIYDTLIARNNLQQVNSLVNENQNSTKTQIIFADIAYNPPKIDLSKYDTKPVEPQKTKKSFNQIAKDYKQFNYSFSIFNDWFSRLRSHSLRFFNGSKF